MSRYDFPILAAALLAVAVSMPATSAAASTVGLTLGEQVDETLGENEPSVDLSFTVPANTSEILQSSAVPAGDDIHFSIYRNGAYAGDESIGATGQLYKDVPPGTWVFETSMDGPDSSIEFGLTAATVALTLGTEVTEPVGGNDTINLTFTVPSGVVEYLHGSAVPAGEDLHYSIYDDGIDVNDGSIGGGGILNKIVGSGTYVVQVTLDTAVAPIGFELDDSQGTIIYPIPEASTWTMLLLGFAGLGAMAWRRKLNPSTIVARRLVPDADRERRL
jgi:hypothetical protein